ncbi:MAG TPA: D-aminoacyl-tRNA deacylase [Myxococcota bacterium]
MRVVVQRVSSARVSVDGEEIAAMGRGLLALVGVGHEDTPEVARDVARRIIHLRVFDDEQGRMNRSLHDVGGTLGVVSQFTLYGDTRQGRRPSYVAAAPAEVAAPLVEVLVQAARDLGVPVVTGRFQAEMEVALVNAGPVTILMDSERRF